MKMDEPSGGGPPDDFEEDNKMKQKKDFTNKFLNEISKMNSLNSNTNSIGCKKCNHSIFY